MRAIYELNLEMINRFYLWCLLNLISLLPLVWLHYIFPPNTTTTCMVIIMASRIHFCFLSIYCDNLIKFPAQWPCVETMGQYINHVKLWEGFTLRLWSKVINWCPVEFHWIIITNNNESEGKIRSIYHSRCHPRLVIGQYIAILSCDWTMCNPRTALWPRPLHCCVLCPQTNILNRIRWQKFSSVLNLLVHCCTCEEDDNLENICNMLCLLLGHRF